MKWHTIVRRRRDQHAHLLLACPSQMADAAHAAAKRGDAGALAAALDGGADVGWCDEPNACSPLHWAAYHGYAVVSAYRPVRR